MQVECPRKLRSGVYVQQAFDRRLTDALWEKACVMSNVHTKLVILELLAKGIIAGDTEPTTYRMLSYKVLHNAAHLPPHSAPSCQTAHSLVD